MDKKIKILRVATISGAIATLLRGQLKFLNNFFEVKAVCSKDDNFDLIQAQEGVQAIPIEIRREISPLKDCIALWKLYSLFRKEKPDIVHSHTPKAGLLSMLAAKFARVPVRIHTFTGVRFETTSGFLRKILIFMDRVTCKCATEIIPEGEGVKNTLLDNRITNKPLDVILNGNINGVDTDYFSVQCVSEKKKHVLRQNLNIADDDFVCCFVGRIVKDKGIEELVEAFIDLTKNNSKIKLVILGSFEPHLDLIDDIIQHQIYHHDQIAYVGYQTDIRPFLAVSNLLVLPSYREGFPNVILQAGSMDLPCLVTDVNGCNEVIISEYNGLIIPKQDVTALKKGLLELISSPLMMENMSSVARDHIINHYQQSEVWVATLDRYRELLNQNCSIR